MTTGPYLWRLLRLHPWLAPLAVLPFMAVYSLAMALALLIRQIFDGVTDAAPITPGLPTLVAAVAAVGLARVAALHGLVLSQLLYRHVISAVLRRNLFIGIAAQPGARALRVAPGDAVNRFRDDPAAITALVNPIGNIIATGLFTIVALLLMVQVSLPMTLAAVVPMIAVGLIGRHASARVGHYRAATRAATSQVTSALGELFGAVIAIKVAGAERRVLEHLRPLDAARHQSALRERTFTEVMISIYGNLTAVGTGLILLAASQGVLTGSVTIGDVALFVFFLDYTAGLTGSLGILLGAYRHASVAFQRMTLLLPDQPAETLVRPGWLSLWGTLPAPPEAPMLDVEPFQTLTVTDLTYHHPASGRGVTGIHLQLTRGTVTVITGRVGAGKTTLLQAILGLLPVQRGEVRWNGVVVTKPAAFFVPPRAAYTPQTPRLFSDPLRDNILLGLPEQRADLPAALHTAVLEQDVARLERGLDTLVGPRGVKLSGGQQQRAAIARMVVRAPEVLVMDDVSSALDSETEQRLCERLFTPDRTCLVASHRRAVLLRADHILVLKDGRVEGEGPLTDVLATCEEMRWIWQDDVASTML